MCSFFSISHTRTVLRECCKGDEASQWKRPKFDPSPRQNPLTKLHKNGMRDYVRDGTRHAKFCSDRFWGFCSPNTWFCRAFWCDYSFYVRFLGSSIKLQSTPLNGFLRKIRHMTSFRARKCLLGVRWLYFIFRPLNFRKTAILGTDFDWAVFSAENRINMGMLQYSITTLNRRHSPIKVV